MEQVVTGSGRSIFLTMQLDILYWYQTELYKFHFDNFPRNKTHFIETICSVAPPNENLLAEVNQGTKKNRNRHLLLERNYLYQRNQLQFSMAFEVSLNDQINLQWWPHMLSPIITDGMTHGLWVIVLVVWNEKILT